MRSFLDKLYLFSGYLAAIFLALIALTIIAQILGRFINVTIDSTETAGFSLAALTFFGLAYTFRSGEHIRVTLITRLLKKNLKKFQELFALFFCIGFVGYLSYWSWDFVYFSFIFDDISPGLLAIPFWIPRLSMSLGITIFFIALIDDFIFILKNKDPSYVKNASPIFKDEI
jgi:TRAP-type C4-dicarboxylate transport system permease small subunit|tara:strand:+ start:1989 stop:2504 length:516 start_codon:yes stop_codon:yes gene_type:complete